MVSEWNSVEFFICRNAARRVMQSAIDVAYRTAGVTSPTRVFVKIGMYSDTGHRGRVVQYAESCYGSIFEGINTLRSSRAALSDQSEVANPRHDNDNTVDELRSLSQEFGDLSRVVTNMQVELDTRVLDGQTASQMDTQLGAYARRRGRGN